MKPNEVRVGNWVLIPTNSEIVIPVFPKQVKGIGLFGGFDFTEPQYPESHVVPAVHCAGIPLNEKIITIGLGFCLDAPECIFYNKREYRFHQDSKGWFLYYREKNLKYIGCLHEFQNLYYALENDEILVSPWSSVTGGR